MPISPRGFYAVGSAPMASGTGITAASELHWVYMLVTKQWQLANSFLYVGRPVLFIFAFDVLVVLAYLELGWEWLASPHIPLGLYGAAISIVVSKRNSSAYARWWEARQLWGRVTSKSRSLARQVVTVLSGDVPEMSHVRERIVRLQIAYAHVLRQHLRGLSPWEELQRTLPAEEVEPLRGAVNVPLAILRRQGELIRLARQKDWVDMMTWQALDGAIDEIGEAQGGCERIKNTPMPKQYDYFPQLFVQLYCLVLPLGMVQNLGYATPLGSTFVGFMFLALDKMGRDLENPFENTVHDVPMTAMSRTIEINLRQLLGDTDLPHAELPKRGVLW